MRAGGLEKAGPQAGGGRDLYAAAVRRDAAGQQGADRAAGFPLLISTNVPDDKLLLQKLSEMGIGASKLPLVGNGAHWGRRSC